MFRADEAPGYSNLARVSGSTSPNLVDFTSSANQSTAWYEGRAAPGCLAKQGRRANWRSLMPYQSADVRFPP